MGSGENNSNSKNNRSDIEDKRKLLLDLVRKRYDIELQSSKDLDNKAGNLIGYVTIVTSIIVGLGASSILGKLSEPVYSIPYLVGIASLLFSIILSLFCDKGENLVNHPSYFRFG